MKILAFNGSPRKKWNTATLLNKALEGAASKGAATELGQAPGWSGLVGESREHAERLRSHRTVSQG